MTEQGGGARGRHVGTVARVVGQMGTRVSRVHRGGYTGGGYHGGYTVSRPGPAPRYPYPAWSCSTVPVPGLASPDTGPRLPSLILVLDWP